VAGIALVGTAVAAASLGTNTHAKAGPAVVGLRTSTLGKVLVNSGGRTLYMYTLDKNGKSACYTGCANFWPPVLTKGKPRASGGLKASLLGTTRRTNGTLQVTYAKHPLYTFAADTKAGAISGQGYESRWYVLDSTGAVIKKSASAAKSPAPPASTTPAGGTAGWG
jgi:predicted lipoprotein with Yx(FWY)xxD motif